MSFMKIYWVGIEAVQWSAVVATGNSLARRF
jgi:hypothetical protein